MFILVWYIVGKDDLYLLFLQSIIVAGITINDGSVVLALFMPIIMLQFVAIRNNTFS